MNGNDHPARKEKGLAMWREGLGKGGRSAAALGFLIFFLVSGTVVALWPSRTEQPIAFNHRRHVLENDMACSECHEFYETETFSGLPGVETCAFCHEEAQGESEEEQKLVKLLEEGTPLEWERLFRQPPHVFYSHRRHVAVAGMECNVCHGSIAESEAPPQRVGRLKMDDCLDCHEKEQVSTECTACHR
ncbi:MAG: cytochrome c3 family protein [Acidobacteriota bacterium]